jgi:tetratricopeptide (TPR) repeat protein
VSSLWQSTDAARGEEYDERWAPLLEDGQNIHGEADLVESLLSRSMLWSRAADGAVRFGLFETVRAFVLAQRPVDSATALRHAAWFARYGEGPWRAGLFGPGGLERLAELTVERANVEAACRWAIDAGESELAAATFLALADALSVRGPARATLGLAERLLALRGLRLARAEVLLATAAALTEVGRRDEAMARLTDAIRLARHIDDVELEGQARSQRAVLRQTAGQAQEALADATTAIKLLKGASARLRGVALVHRATVLRGQGRAREGLVDIDLGLAVLQQAGDAIDAAIALGALGNLRRDLGDSLRVWGSAAWRSGSDRSGYGLGIRSAVTVGFTWMPW